MPSASLLVPRAEPDETSRDLGTARKKPFAELVPRSAFSPTRDGRTRPLSRLQQSSRYINA